MAVNMHIPWYATVFRGDKLEAALHEIAPVALKYGATSFAVYRYSDDRYKFLQIAQFEDKAQWERYWEGPDFIDWRVANQSYYQVPVIYGPADVIIQGEMRPETTVEDRAPVENQPGDLVG